MDKELPYVHTAQYYLAMQKNELSIEATGMVLKIVLNEKSQTKQCIFPHE